MLLKLIKHDFRALSHTLLPLNLAVLAAGLVETVLLAVVVRSNAASGGSAGTVTIGVALSLPMILIGIAIFASSLVSMLLIAMHFYQNLIGDEGYLMFTLPTTPARIVASKLITALLYTLINGLAIAISVDMALLFGTGTEGLINKELIALIEDLAPMLKSVTAGANLPAILLALSAFSLTGTASQLLKLYFAMAVGGLFAKKMKLLAIIGVYFGTNIVLGIVKNVFRALFALGKWSSGLAAFSGADAVIPYLWYSAGVSLAACALFFFLSERMFSKRLNLQ